MSFPSLDLWEILGIGLGIIVFALPVLIYYLRAPYKPDGGSVLVLLLALMSFEVMAFIFGNALISLEAGAWSAGIIWIAACIGGWVTPDLARVKSGRDYMD